MKKYIFPSVLLFLFLSSCTSTNRIYVDNDPYKVKTTVKLNQSLKGYSDEKRTGLNNSPDYFISFKHYFAYTDKQETVFYLDIKLSTGVRAYEIEPTLYISTDNRISRLEADNKVVKMYQEGNSSSTSETSSSTVDDPDDEEEPKVTTITTYSTSSSHDTYQLMQLRFNPQYDLLKEISMAGKVTFRLYIENEVIDIPLINKDRRKFNKYVEEVNNFYR